MMYEQSTRWKEQGLKSAIRFQQFLTTHAERYIYFPREARHFSRLFPKATSTLDVGAGTGFFAESLKSSMPDLQPVSTDIESRNIGNSTFVIAEGNSLPFPDNSFDITTIMYVLHHSAKPEEVLREARRVSRHGVMVCEDTYKNRFQKWFYKLHLNSYRLTITSDGLEPRTNQEWEEMFLSEGMEIKRVERIRKAIGHPVSRYRYLLQDKTITEQSK